MNKTYATLFVEVSDKGIEHDHHMADLYLPYTQDNTEMLKVMACPGQHSRIK